MPRDTCLAPERGYAEVAAVQPAQARHSAPKGRSSKNREGNEGFTKVERKKKKPSYQNKCGTAPNRNNLLLRAEVPTTQLYMSRVHHAFTEKDVVEYLHAKTGLNMRVERLESRHRVCFNSFVVRMPTEHLPTYMKEDCRVPLLPRTDT